MSGWKNLCFSLLMGFMKLDNFVEDMGLFGLTVLEV